jgi:hypothetical protein
MDGVVIKTSIPEEPQDAAITIFECLPFPYGLRRKEANVMVVRVGRKREGKGR